MNALTSGRCAATTRALGLVGKFITSPWMRLVSINCNILDMNQYFQAAVTKLQTWKKDQNLVLASITSIFTDIPITKDRQYEEFLHFSSDENRESTKALLAQFLCAIADVMARQLASQLPEGVFCDPSPELRHQAASTTATDNSGERKFAMVDAHIRRAPSATMGTIESKTMF